MVYPTYLAKLAFANIDRLRINLADDMDYFEGDTIRIFFPFLEEIRIVKQGRRLVVDNEES